MELNTDIAAEHALQQEHDMEPIAKSKMKSKKKCRTKSDENLPVVLNDELDEDITMDEREEAFYLKPTESKTSANKIITNERQLRREGNIRTIIITDN